MGVYLLKVLGVLSVILIGGSVSQSTSECPSQEERLICTFYIRDVAERLTVPVDNIYTSKTFFITPLDWNQYQADEVCKVKDAYESFLLCALRLRQRCMLNNRRDPFLSQWRIHRAVDLFCSQYRCDDCSRKWCDRCDKDRAFNFDCTRQQYPDLATCMRSYENDVYVPPSSDINLQRQEFNNYQCTLINHHQMCTRLAYKDCGFYTKNLTDYFTLYAIPEICSASTTTVSTKLPTTGLCTVVCSAMTHTLSAILVLITTILAICH